MRSSRIIRHSDAARAFACRFFLKMVKMNLYFLYASHILAQPQPRRSQSLQGQSTVIPYTFVPPKALSLLITASNKCQTNQQYNERYSKIDCEVIHVLFPPQSAGRIRAIYFFFLSAPFAMLVYNPLVNYERGSSSTACALRQRYLLYCLLMVC